MDSVNEKLNATALQVQDKDTLTVVVKAGDLAEMAACSFVADPYDAGTFRRASRDGNPTTKVCSIQPRRRSPRRLAKRPAWSASATWMTAVPASMARNVDCGGSGTGLASLTLSCVDALAERMVRAMMPPSSRTNQARDGRVTLVRGAIPTF